MNRKTAAAGLVALAGLTLGLGGCGSGEGPKPATGTVAVREVKPPSPGRPATPAGTSRAVAGGPQVWAVVVGVDRYEDAAIRDCRGAVRDAVAVRDWVVRTARWGDDHVLLMTDAGAPAPPKGPEAVRDLRPTRANLDWAVRGWLAGRVKPGDLALIYFAGQAVALPPGEGAGAAGGPREFLLPIDARRAFLDATGWSLGDALDPLAGAGTAPILCLLDTSPRGRGRPVLPVGDDPGLGARMMKNIARWPGVAVWLAADDRPAEDGDREAGGPFASALVRALDAPGRRTNLLGLLDVLGRDRMLAAQGFRTLGGLPPGATLWPEDRRDPRIDDPGLVLQRGHAAAVRAIAFNADGSLMASGSDDSTIRLWRARDRTLLRVLPDHANGVSCLAISPDGRLLAGGDGMGGFRAWDLAGDVPMALRDPSPHDAGIVALGFLPDGRGVVSADRDGRWALWDLSGPSVRLVGLPGASTRPGRLLTFARQAGPVAAAMALPAPGGDDRVGLFRPDREGDPMAIDAGPGGTIERLALSADGRRLAVATASGLVELRDLEHGLVRPPLPFAAPIRALELAAGRLVVRSAEGLHVLALDGEGERHDLGVEGEVERLVVSPNGRRIAAVTAGEGAVHAWDIDAASGLPRPLALAESAGGGAVSLAFRPDGAALAVGDLDGGIRAWDLPEGSRRPPIPPYRGQVAHVAASPDRERLLQVTRDGVAKVWDLEGGGLPVALVGRFRPSGAFLPGGEGLVLLDEAGDPVVFGLDGRRRPDLRFEPPAVPGRDAAEGDFRAVAVSPDGLLVAAGGAEEPLVCVWGSEGGRPRHELRKPHVERILTVQFAADGRHLLTASEGEAGVVAVWDLRARTGAPRRVIPPQGRLPLTAAAMSPVDPSRIAVARRDGRASVVELWGPGDGDLRRLGQVQGEIAALAFSAGGEHLAAAGWEKLLYLWSTGPAAAPVTIRARPQHDEKINTVAAWPGAPLFVTGSDDTTMRFWRVDAASGESRALGTLVAAQDSPAWVAYTPDGLFDGSPEGVELVTRRVGDDVARLDQCYDLGHLARLTDYLRRSEPPPRSRAVAGGPPPQLALDLAAPAEGRKVELVLRLGPDEPLREVRLYHNGSVIGGDLDRDLGDGRRSVRIKATLAAGENRFFAMGGRSGSVDGRSNLVEVPYDGATEPGSVHVLALGVGKHRKEELRLQFAAEDAKAMSAFLRERGINGGAGANITDLLLDDDVSPRSLDEAFGRIQARVAGRPQDTIIVFLAGHSGVRGDRLGLLLSRGAAADPPEVIPYGDVLRNLAYLDALKRLIIIDACDAGAILDEGTVRKARQGADRDQRRARTSYLLAARRGEVANEVEQLRHGLLTYVLLRGMGAKGLEEVPDLTVFREHENADFDRNERIDTAELQRYADLTLAPLAAHYPQLVSRGRAGPRAVPAPWPAPAQNLRTQEVTAPPFPLVQVPGGGP